MAVNNIAYIEKTLPQVVDEVFVKESLTEDLFGGNAVRVDFLDAKTCKVFKVGATPLQDYARANNSTGATNAFGGVVSNTETFTLGQERYCAIPVDTLDSLDDGGTVIGHLAKRYAREHVVPEFDAYRFSKLASYTSITFGNRKVGAIADNTIIGEFDKGFEYMEEQNVPANNQVIYVSPAIMTKIRGTSELNRRLMIEPAAVGASRSIIKYEDREIRVVPSNRFYTDIAVGNGYAPSSSSKIINFLIVDKSAPIVIKKLAFTKIYDSQNGEAYFGYVGKLLTQLYYHDLFVPDNKKVAIYCHVSSTASADRGVLIEAVAGTTQGKTIINSFMGQPNSIANDGKLYWATSAAPTIGGNAPANTITLGSEFQPNGSHNWFALVYGGKVVAVSKDWSATTTTGEEGKLPVGA